MASKISINKVMDEISSIQNQITGLQLLLKNKKAIMAKYFDKSGKRTASSDECTVYVQEHTKIEYDINKILKSVDKSLTNQFIDKSYIITSPKELFTYLKQYGITAMQLSRWITVNKEVNQEKLNTLYEHGKISINDLKGCYEAKTNKSIVLKLKNTNREIPIIANTKEKENG